jgi:hypothetical protein
MTTILAIGMTALLFALFGLVRPRNCGGQCGGCNHSCAHYTGEDSDVE